MARSDSAFVATESSVVSTSPMSKARVAATATSASQAPMMYQRWRVLNRATRAVMDSSRYFELPRAMTTLPSRGAFHAHPLTKVGRGQARAVKG